MFLTSPPWVPYFMCSFPSSGRLGPARAEVGLGFAEVGWFRRFRLPPPAGLVPFPSASVFFFPCPFRVCLLWARCVVLVFALSLFFCVPLFASWLSEFHFIFSFSLSSRFHCHFICPAAVGRVCVCAICIDVKLHYAAGRVALMSYHTQ